jgi:hypothetical protein
MFSDRLRNIRLAYSVLFLTAPIALASQVSLPDQSAAPGTSVLIPVAFTAEAASVSGVQFDIEYDNSAMSLVITIGDAAVGAEKNLYMADVAPNKKRVLVVGLNQNLIPDGTLVNISASINDNAPDGVYALGLSNVCGTDSSGDSTLVTGSDAALTVQAGSQGQAQGVLNAARLLPGPVAPVEFIALIGSGTDPAALRQVHKSSATTALITLHSTKIGPWILNQDSSARSPSDPLGKRTVIALFAARAGQTNPQGTDGQITGAVLPTPQS